MRGFHCDLQRPSCWKCQQYFLPCHYEHENAQKDQQIEPPDHLEADPTWQDSVRANPYHNLEGQGKLRRIDRRFLKSRRSRLSKPIPPAKRALYDLDDIMKDSQESLLGSSSPSTSDVGTESRTASPTGWERSEPLHQGSRPNSSRGSGYTTSQASAESQLTGSLAHPSLTIRTTPPTTGSSGAWLPAPDGGPKIFWCTFCLEQCSDQDEWEMHEMTQHIPERIWICMPWGPVEQTDGYDVCVFCGVADPDSDHSSQHTVQCCYSERAKDRTFISKDALRQHVSDIHNQKEMTRKMENWWRSTKDNDWYWNCGFCDKVFSRWTDRAVHIGEHFNEGTDISSWDPLTPPYPLNRTTLNCAAWFPPLGWDARTLWDLERKNSCCPRSPSIEEQNRCKHCDVDVYFSSDVDVKRHESIWHSRREVWSCPTIDDIGTGILAPYFFPVGTQPNLPNSDLCPYCNKLFDELTEWHPELDFWDVCVLHLEDVHNFTGCEPPCKSIRPGEVLLHLANVHNVRWGEMTAEIIESCRKEERPLAKKMNATTIDRSGRGGGN